MTEAPNTRSPDIVAAGLRADMPAGDATRAHFNFRSSQTKRPDSHDEPGRFYFPLSGLMEVNACNRWVVSALLGHYQSLITLTIENIPFTELGESQDRDPQETMTY